MPARFTTLDPLNLLEHLSVAADERSGALALAALRGKTEVLPAPPRTEAARRDTPVGGGTWAHVKESGEPPGAGGDAERAEGWRVEGSSTSVEVSDVYWTTGKPVSQSEGCARLARRLAPTTTTPRKPAALARHFRR